jgi:hypothetical protein
MNVYLASKLNHSERAVLLIGANDTPDAIARHVEAEAIELNITWQYEHIGVTIDGCAYINAVAGKKQGWIKWRDIKERNTQTIPFHEDENSMPSGTTTLIYRNNIKTKGNPSLDFSHVASKLTSNVARIQRCQ